MNKDIAAWIKACFHCQRSKITRHNCLTPEKLPIPDARFDHVHFDLRPFDLRLNWITSIFGFRYCVTLIDRFSRWPEVIPLTNIIEDIVAKSFFTTWISGFGSSQIITIDQETHFESNLFKALAKLVGTKRTKITIIQNRIGLSNAGRDL